MKVYRFLYVVLLIFSANQVFSMGQLLQQEEENQRLQVIEDSEELYQCLLYRSMQKRVKQKVEYTLQGVRAGVLLPKALLDVITLMATTVIIIARSKGLSEQKSLAFIVELFPLCEDFFPQDFLLCSVRGSIDRLQMIINPIAAAMTVYIQNRQLIHENVPHIVEIIKHDFEMLFEQKQQKCRDLVQNFLITAEQIKNSLQQKKVPESERVLSVKNIVVRVEEEKVALMFKMLQDTHVAILAKVESNILPIVEEIMQIKHSALSL